MSDDLHRGRRLERLEGQATAPRAVCETLERFRDSGRWEGASRAVEKAKELAAAIAAMKSNLHGAFGMSDDEVLREDHLDPDDVAQRHRERWDAARAQAVEALGEAASNSELRAEVWRLARRRDTDD